MGEELVEGGQEEGEPADDVEMAGADVAAAAVETPRVWGWRRGRRSG